MKQSIDTMTSLKIQGMRTMAKWEMEQIQENVKAGVAAIESAKKESLESERHNQNDINNKKILSSNLTNLVQSAKSELTELTHSTKLKLTELVKASTNQLRSETGRLQKELLNNKTETMAAIDRHTGQQYPGNTQYDPNTATPHMTQPSMTQQSSVVEESAKSPLKPPPYGTNKGDTLEERMKNYNTRVEQEECNKIMITRSKTVMEKLQKLHSKSFEDIFYFQGNEPPTPPQIVSFYTSIVDVLNSYCIPIVPYEQLTLTSGTYPADKPLLPAVHAKVSSLLLTKLNSSIPKQWHKIRSIVESYTTTKDGYSALFTIMTNTIGYLCHF